MTETLDLKTGEFHKLEGVQELRLNDVLSVRLSLAQGLLADSFQELPRTGSLLLLDPNSLDSIAAGIVTVN